MAPLRGREKNQSETITKTIKPMTRTFKFVAKRGQIKTEITIRHTEENAYSPDIKKSVEEMKNGAYDLLRDQKYNYSDIKQVR